MLDSIGPWQSLAPGAWRAALQAWQPEMGVQRREKQRLLQLCQLVDLSPQRGEAWFPLALPRSSVDGLLVRVRIGGTGRAVDPAVVDAARRWIMALAGVTTPGVLNEMAPVYPDLPAEVAISGKSMGLACAVAMLSSLLGRPPVSTVIVSAELGQAGPCGWVEAVGQRTEKAKIETLEAPGHDAWNCEKSTSALKQLDVFLGGGWRRDLSDGLGCSAEALARSALDTYRRRDYANALNQSEAALYGAQGAWRGLALLLSGACWMHQAKPTIALERIDEALTLLTDVPPESGMPDLVLEDAHALAGIALLDNGYASRAVSMLSATLETLEDHPLQRFGPSQWRPVALRVAGSLRRALVFSGRALEAPSVQEKWPLSLARRNDQLARSYGDLAESLRILGRLPEAQAALREARTHLTETLSDDRPFTSRYLAVYEVRSGLSAPLWPVAAPDWKNFPQPLEVLETLLAGPVEAMDAWMQTHALSEGSQSQRLVYLGAAARMVVKHGRCPDWLTQLIEQTRQLDHVEPAAEDALEHLAKGNGEPWSRIAPY